jgi:eukaryotic-like serine/threonine-protein kinase
MEHDRVVDSSEKHQNSYCCNMKSMESTPENVGPYTIIREIGRGGMGVVYLARDTKLDRDVAIKALPEEMAADADRLIRFEREAKSLAALNHPNIAGIYGVEEQDGRKYLILEFVEGETLGERLDRGPIPVDEALEIAIGIATGVEAAHEAGIIHRDLKPDNIKITPEGTVKVLDFGLAKVEEASTSTVQGDSPTLIARHSPTIPGAILGTAAYMSPEQARGRKVDKRTDIWSFGVMLYEMLTGTSPFVGETATDSIGAVLHKDVDLDQLPSETPAMVRHMLRRCLVRDKRQRLQAIGDARVDLELAFAEPGLDSARTGSSGKLPWIIAVAGSAIGLAALGVIFSGVLSPPAPSKSVLHLAFPIGPNPQSEEGVTFAFSPVSRTVAYIAQDPGDDSPDPATAIYLRDLDSDEVRRLAGTEYAQSLSFSPDGTQLAFTWYDPDSSREEVRRVSVSGGPVLQVFADPTGNKYVMRVSLAWISNDEMLAIGADRFTLYRVPIAGGDIAEIATFAKDGEWLFDTPSMLGPDSVFLSRLSLSAAREHMRLFRLDLETGETKEILDDAKNAQLLPGGRLLFVRGETLCVAQFDADSARVIGAVTPIVSGLLPSESYSVSAQGDLLVARSVVEHESSQLMSIDRAGQRVPLIESRQDFSAPVVLSGDGRQLAITILRPSMPPAAYTLDLDTGYLRPALPSADVSWSEGWAPDGRLIANHWFTPTHEELFLLDPSSSAEATPILPETDGLGSQINATMTPDGRFVVFQYRTNIEPDTWDIYTVDLESDQEPVPIAVVATSAGEADPRLSPDGKWLAYISDASGTRQVVLQAFDPDRLGEPTRVFPVSFDGGHAPLWSPDGSELFFLDTDLENLFGVEITTDPVMSITPPKLILGAADLNLGGIDSGMVWHPIDITPDGERFVYIEDVGDSEPPTYLDLTINWLDELDKLVPPRR